MGTLSNIAPTTGAKTVNVSTGNYERITFAASVLATTETVAVNILLPDGVSVIAAMDTTGSTGGLTATNPTRTYYGGADYQIVKSATAGSCGVYTIPVGKDG